MKSLQHRIEDNEVVILDGAMGTELERRGAPMDGVAWSAAATGSHPHLVRQAHEDYIRAGADVIITNTFAASRHVLEAAGLGGQVGALNRGAVALAREARDGAAGDAPVAIAGSLSSFAPEADNTRAPTPAQARAGFREQAELLAGAGVDLLVLEMMRDIELGSCAIEEAVATGLPTWVGFSCRMAGDGTTVLLFGRRADEPFGPAVKTMMEIGGSVAGVMHTDVEDTAAALEVLLGNWTGPVAAYPHSGGFVMPNWQFDDIISPDDYAAEARKWVESGVQIVGGCCGIGPGHVRLLKDRLPRHAPAAGRS